MKTVLFSYKTKQGYRVEYAVDAREARDEKILLLERSFAENIISPAIYENNEWRLLDYYND